MIRVSNVANATGSVVRGIASTTNSFANSAIQRLCDVTSATPLDTVSRSHSQSSSPCRHLVILAIVASSVSLVLPHGAIAQTDLTSSQGSSLYKPRGEGESEFDNRSEAYVKDWREGLPREQYEDTEFGGLMYNEASTPTKLEVLRLLSKDTPSMMVFMTAMSMGLDIETVAQASAKYQPEKSRDLAASAVNLLPILTESTSYLYSSYELEDLEREEDKPYSVERVVEKFFEQRLVLRPYPDWFDGQFHFLASAAELKKMQIPQRNVQWYRSKSTEVDTSNRPIFVSLYESSSSILIDGEERIDRALKENPNALLPVVFIFNRLNERPIDEMGYPLTIKGMQAAYVEKNLMLTPTPEWQLGEYHMYASLDEFYEIFNIPEEDDFEPEAWQKLLEEAEDYTVTDTAFLLVVLGAPEDEDTTTKRSLTTEQLYAAWDDPRTESSYPYVGPSDGQPATLKNLMGQGLIFSRPDLIAALNALGVTQVPVAFYYLDSSRVKPYIRGPRSLIQSILGVIPSSGPFGGGGGIICASPPCTEEEQ